MSHEEPYGWMRLEYRESTGTRYYSFAGLCGRRFGLRSSLNHPGVPGILEPHYAKDVSYTCCVDPKGQELCIELGDVLPECHECLINLAEKLYALHKSTKEFLESRGKEK